ncbi:MAG: ParB/RepB/Spo0J family partition protein [Phycisphaerales bacterium]|nr:ParB/RepB/Spo0J family partition protein [Phycisphaerales bacterium]
MTVGKIVVTPPLFLENQLSKLNKPRLGRGLSSLISMDSSDAPATESHSVNSDGTANAHRSVAPLSNPVLVGGIAEQGKRVLDLQLADIQPNPHQPRREFDDATLAELAASLRTNGLIQPIVVRQTSQGFELIAGERRLKAAKLAGFTTISAIVNDVDGLTQAQMALVENIQREDLNPIDRAYAYKTLLQQLGLSHSELALRLGEDRSTISNHLRLLDLAASTHELVKTGALTFGHAKVLAGVSDLLEQDRLARLVVAQGLSVRNLARLAQGQQKVDPATIPQKKQNAHIKQLEVSLSRQLGMRVAVRSGKQGKGKIVISYSNLDEFDQLLAKLRLEATES